MWVHLTVLQNTELCGCFCSSKWGPTSLCWGPHNMESSLFRTFQSCSWGPEYPGPLSSHGWWSWWLRMSESEVSLMGLCATWPPLSVTLCDTTRMSEPGRRCSLGTPYSSPAMSCRSLFRPLHEDYEHYIYGMLFKQELGLWALQSQYLGPFLSIMWCWVSYWTSSARISHMSV